MHHLVKLFDYHHVVNVVFVENVQELHYYLIMMHHHFLDHEVFLDVVDFVQRFSKLKKNRTNRIEFRKVLILFTFNSKFAIAVGSS